MPIVTTGQITIVDNNDARPLTAYITANPGPQQVFTKDESLQVYTPDWTLANANAGVVFTARAFAGATGSAQDVTGLLTNRRWSFDMATPITGTNGLIGNNAQMAAVFTQGAGRTFTAVHNAGGSTLTVNANMLPDVSQAVLYFEGDYTDPITGLVSRVIAQIGLNLVRTGTNAVYVLMEGNTAIEQATGGTKNVIAVSARLMRAAGVDTTGVSYRWYENNGGTQIVNTAPFTTEYGLRTINPGVAPNGNNSHIGVNLPAAGAWASQNTLVIHESAVQDMGVYRVEVQDADGTIFQTYFTIWDVSDPYDLKVLSSAGDKLQNGVGSTTLTPDVYYGASRITNLTGWTFFWTFFNKDGKRGAFIDTTRTALAGGRTITAHTTGNNAVFTYSGTAITFSAGDIIKVVTPGGDERFYEVASGTGNTVTCRVPTTHSSWLNTTNWPAATAGQFTNGRLFVCLGSASAGQVTTSGSAGLVLGGDDIDAKARIICEGDRP